MSANNAPSPSEISAGSDPEHENPNLPVVSPNPVPDDGSVDLKVAGGSVNPPQVVA